MTLTIEEWRAIACGDAPVTEEARNLVSDFDTSPAVLLHPHVSRWLIRSVYWEEPSGAEELLTASRDFLGTLYSSPIDTAEATRLLQEIEDWKPA